jgi:deoxyribodipyrimidine photo-lyase
MVGLQVVWFKRDLRVRDHVPLAEAAARGPVCALYIVEPGFWSLPEMHACHWRYIRESLIELDRSLRELGGRLTVRIGPARAVLASLAAEVPGGFQALWSHQETGQRWTFQRDRAVARWCRERGISWQEFGQDGVCRPHPDRDGWAARWTSTMSRPATPVPGRIVDVTTLHPDFFHGTVPENAPGHAVWEGPSAEAGEAAARARLFRFLEHGAAAYPRQLSSPNTAWEGCSRLSVHLAWGTLSTRTVYHAIATRRRIDAHNPAAVEGLDALEGRLRWRAHFMQKLEDDPDLEIRSQHDAVANLRTQADPERLLSWEHGRTGWPLVDAVVRALHAERWINFRMRAMVVSIAAYTLWLPWQPIARRLATWFQDFEPGIHFPQVQMQAGTTGIAALRIYDPEKQGYDHDPDGTFIRRWVPELARVPVPDLHAPWRIPPSRARTYGFRPGADYPNPPVDARLANERARRTLEAARGAPEARSEAIDLHRRHGSRLSPERRRWTPPRGRP